MISKNKALSQYSFVDFMKARWVSGGNNEIVANVYLLLNRFTPSISSIANIVKSRRIMVNTV